MLVSGILIPLRPTDRPRTKNQKNEQKPLHLPAWENNCMQRIPPGCKNISKIDIATPMQYPQAVVSPVAHVPNAHRMSWKASVTWWL